MSEPKIVRLVRCPKCQNLLPELADYEVYQCGGCGTVLRAKVKEQEANVLADRSDEEKLGVFSKSDGLLGKGMQQTLESLSEKEVAGRNVSDMDVESDCIAFKSKENFGGKTDKYLKSQSVKINDSGTKTDPKVSASELGNVEQLLNYFGDVSLTQRSEDIPNWQGEMSEHCGLPKGENEGGRSLNYKNYQDEGPSNYFSDTSYGNNGEPGKDSDGFNMPKRIGSLQKDRSELLHMMEELRYQLRRSGNLGVNIREKNPIDQNAAHQGPNRSSTSGMFNKNDAAQDTDMQHGFMPDKPLNSPYYYSHHHPQYPHAGRQGMGVSNPHLFPYGHNDMHGYGNYIESRIMGGPFLTPSHCEHQVPHLPCVHRQAFAPYPTRRAPSTNNGLLHPSVCGCYSDHYRVPQPDYPDGTRCCDTHNNPMVYPRNIPGPPQPGCNLKSSGTSSSLQGPSARTRLDDDMTCYNLGFVRQRKQKEALAKGGRYCQPIASGAPFIICRICSKLLQLPKTTFSITSKRQKLSCGACSTVMDCALINKKFTISVSGETKKIVKETSPCLDKVTYEGISSEILRWEDKPNSVSDDFDSSNHECQAVNGKPPVLTNGLDLTSNETQGSQSLPRSSPASFEGMEFSGVASPNGSPVQDQLGHSFNANVTSRVWKGSQSTRSDHDKVITKDRISRQNSLNETSSTAQIEEVSFNVYSKARVSENSDPETQRNDPVRTNKGSSFAGVIKKRLKGLSRSNHSADSREGNITVNGCKIPDRLVKKAEKLAGPIQPGNYWYDFRAGFWGVIGGPCLGIIPPFIEEFNYPMPANCSSGATGVFVNGRELQQIDLDLLASRGLPSARGRSYVIEISGKVFDKDSGEELDGLGKLAPTIEKVKHGFGMKPRTKK